MYSEWTHSALHYTTLHFIQHYTTLHYTTLHYTTLHYTTLQKTTLHYTTLHTTLHYTTLHHTTLHYKKLHYTTLHCTTLHSTTIHYTVPGGRSVHHGDQYAPQAPARRAWHSCSCREDTAMGVVADLNRCSRRKETRTVDNTVFRGGRTTFAACQSLLRGNSGFGRLHFFKVNKSMKGCE
jgi:hypothetical protein